MDFLFKQASFHPFGMLHVLPLVIIFCIGFTGILFAKSQLKREGQKNLIFGISLIPLVFFQGFKQFSEGLSYTRPAMYATLLGNVINVILNYFLIFGVWIFDFYNF